ncbi:MAG: VPS10 domain-containing protein, partial [Saprospiraceae bacterium]
MKIKLLFTLMTLFTLAWQLPAQKIDLDKLKGIKARSIGPAGMSGRITAITADPSNTNIVYAGAASGGVWKSWNGGISWEPIFDKQPTQSIGAIAVSEANPQEVWVGTGEGNPRNSQNTGLGIFKSLDGGKTWQHMGLKETKTIHRVIIHRDNPNVIIAGAQGSPFGPNEERGVYKTTDGGKTWKKILYVNNQTGCADLIVDPTNPNKLIAAMWEYGRKPWTFKSGGPGSGLYVSYDGGETWAKRTSADGLPEGELGRIGLAIAPSKPNIVYALVEAKDNNLYKSTDGGEKWTKVNTNDRNVSNRPFYYHEIYVDPQNENRIFNLYSEVSISQDGGKTFDIFERVTHSDHHAFWIDPKDPNYMMLGSDGGLYISRDGGAKWMFAENIPVGQFYHVNYDMEYPYNIGGGMQDNGSWVGPHTAWKQGGILNYDWQEVYFGDGFDLGFRPDDSRYVYAMSQGGRVGYVDTKTGKTQLIMPVHPDPSVELRFNWNAAFAQNPFHPNGIYYGSQFVHK